MVVGASEVGRRRMWGSQHEEEEEDGWGRETWTGEEEERRREEWTGEEEGGNTCEGYWAGRDGQAGNT